MPRLRKRLKERLKIMSNVLNSEEVENIKICGRILKSVLDKVESEIRPGVTTDYLDQIAENTLHSNGAYPAFKNFPGDEAGPFPASLCVSINDEIVHGIPSGNRIIRDGDIVSIDLGAFYEGVYSDAAKTVAVGKVPARVDKLIKTAKQCLFAGIGQAQVGNHIGDIGLAIETRARQAGFNVIRDLVGHGIGRAVHLEPSIPNFGKKGQGAIIVEGMALAIEPMIVAGSHRIRIKPDGWTIITADHSLAAHFEHTVVIENGGPVIVT